MDHKQPNEVRRINCSLLCQGWTFDNIGRAHIHTDGRHLRLKFNKSYMTMEAMTTPSKSVFLKKIPYRVVTIHDNVGIEVPKEFMVNILEVPPTTSKKF